MPAKYERCVRKVKRQKSARNPYAVCSYLRAKGKKETEVDWFSKMFGLPKRTVRRKLKKEGFIVNAKGKKKAKKKYYPDLKPVMNGELEKLLKYFKL